jgi:hypothetical protein
VKHCIDCQAKLTPEARSRHQPAIRCLKCFDRFADGVEAVFAGKATSARQHAIAATKETPMSFTDGKQRVATEEECSLRWLGGAKGKHFRCFFCGHCFKVGDKWRFVFTNDVPGAGGNPLVCENCDDSNENLREKWKAMWQEYRSPKWWYMHKVCEAATE